MNKKTVFLAATISVLSLTGVWAQGSSSGEATVFQRFPSALGAYACFPATGGLTYQHWFGRAGLETTLGAIVSPDGDYDYNAQAAFQYMLYGEDFADWFSGALYTNVMLAHRGQGVSGVYSPYLYLGLGVGIEMVVLRHLSTSVEFMYVGSLPLELAFGFGGSLKYRY